MALTKKQRLEVLNKSGGLCWYCGVKLNKGWHADHFHPVVRSDGKMAYPELDVIENKVPSCPQCNNFKHSMNIEGYRFSISEQFKNVPLNSTGARQLVRLGLVSFEKKDILFWYEKNGLSVKSEMEMLNISNESQSIKWEKDKQEDNYYSCDFGEFLCTLKNFGTKWVCIAMSYDWEELGRDEFKNGRARIAMLQAAEWAIRIKESLSANIDKEIK